MNYFETQLVPVPCSKESDRKKIKKLNLGLLLIPKINPKRYQINAIKYQ